MHLFLAAGTTPVRELPHHISIKNATTGKICSFLHQFQECVFAFPTDDGGVAEINH
jgi:hypothetical protein